MSKYKDPASQLLVRNLIQDLMNCSPKCTREYLNNVFKSLINKDLPNLPLSKASKVALLALRWTIIIDNRNHITSDERLTNEHVRLLEYQSLLFQYAGFGGFSKITENAEKLMNDYFAENENIVSEYFNFFVEKNPESNVIVNLILNQK